MATRSRIGWVPWLLAGLLLAALAGWWRFRPRPAAVPEVLLAELVRLDGIMVRRAATNTAFDGIVLEQFPDGRPKSRSGVHAGRIHGLSEGWHTNGVLQVQEWFTNGVAHGPVLRWRADGSIQSKGAALAGVLHGDFRRMHPDGTIAEAYEMSNGVPVGVARSWHPDGSLKAEVTFKDGRPGRTQFHAAGVVRGSLTSPSRVEGVAR